MKRFGVHRPSSATALATVALIVALGGTAFAGPITRLVSGDKVIRKHSLSGNRLRPHTLTGAQINMAQLGTVPSANTANFAATAGSANTANNAGGAPPTGAAGGDLSGSYPNPALAAPEAWHMVGESGEPAFQNAWQDSGPVTPYASFYKDREGVVHLEGEIFGKASQVPIFQLPPGYRPPGHEVLEFAVACTCVATDNHGDTVNVDAGELAILGADKGAGNDGAVVLASNLAASPGSGISLDNVSFRAEQ